MRIRRVFYAVAIGAALAVSGVAAPAQAGEKPVVSESVLQTLGWGHG
ncbi:hypothetical protein [Micromonospora sp. NPDC049204]